MKDITLINLLRYVLNVIFNFCFGVALLLAAIIVKDIYMLSGSDADIFNALLGGATIGCLVGLIGHGQAPWWKKFYYLPLINLMLCGVLIFILTISSISIGINTWLPLLYYFSIVEITACVLIGAMALTLKPWQKYDISNI